MMRGYAISNKISAAALPATGLVGIANGESIFVANSKEVC